ncbi:MAG: phosphoglucosamine mutase [Pseudomonadota bacterium]
MRRLFGTDGIRGQANKGAMTAITSLQVAMATAQHFRRGEHRHLAVIGKDTRLSCYMLEPALTAGFASMGMDVILVGPMPTPAVAMLTRSLRADLGVMISASHNPYQDNGIKLFGPDGYKLSDEVEESIEAMIETGTEDGLAASADLGRVRRLDDAPGRYIEFAKNSFPRDLRLDGLKIVIDCAHGAAYKVAPTVLHELGATVIPLGVSPNGTNINDACGATHTEVMQKTVVETGADLGIALDGDADRLILCDETGTRIDGDQLMGLIAQDWLMTDRLSGGHVVATVMSNLGLERFLEGIGLGLIRTPVGDRYVVSRMRQDGINLGGEQSGHMILSDYATTGDGLIAALQVLAVLVRNQRSASSVAKVFSPLPQILRNVRFAPGTAPMELPSVQSAIQAGEEKLSGTGRLLIRKSGTEPVVRVMAEGENDHLIKTVVDDIVVSMEQAQSIAAE